MPIKVEGTERPGDIVLPQSEVVDREEVLPTAGEIFGSAFRLENTVGSYLSSDQTIYERVEGYDPYDDIGGYEDFPDRFMEAKSPEHTAAIKAQIDREKQDQQNLAAGGGLGFLATISAGATDPVLWATMVVPEAGVLRAGTTFTRAAAATGAIAGVSEIPVELIKQRTQETRTGTDAAFAIGGATVFGGLLGGAANGIVKSQRRATEAKLDDMLNYVETDELPQGIQISDTGGSVGAAAAADLSDADLSLVGDRIFKAGEAAGKVGAIISGVSPQLRTLTSRSIETRKIASGLMESTLIQKANTRGESAVPEGGAAETRMKAWDGNHARALQALDDNYVKYRGGRVKAKLATIAKGDYLSPQEFRIEVGKAMRRGDTHSIPEVEAVAKSMRKELFDPLKDAAIEARLLPPDVDVTTATSYLMRVYNKDKIIALRPEWNRRVESWMKGEVGRARSADTSKIDVPALTAKAQAADITADEMAQLRLALDSQLRDADISQVVDEITDKILGMAGNRSEYGTIPVPSARGPLKERTFNIPDELIENFLESDIDFVAASYKATMAPDVEISRIFSGPDMKEEIQAIRNEYSTMVKAENDPKKLQKLQKRLEQDIIDIEAQRDLLRGMYKVPTREETWAYKQLRRLRSVNFLTMLGGMTVSSIPDVGSIVMRGGMRSTGRALKTMATNWKKFAAAKDDMKRLGIGLDMVLNSRAASMFDHAEVYGRPKVVDQALHGATSTFSKATLMAPWNAAFKQLASVITQDRILNATVKSADGTIKKADRTRLAAAGIGNDMAKRIAAQFRKYGDDGDLWLSNGEMWDDRGAFETLRSAITKDTDTAIITPGKGERPLWTNREIGKTIFQFKSFVSSAHHRILISNLQLHDAQALNGFLLMTALGSATYFAKQTVSDRPISDDPTKLVVEALDRSGTMGYFWDINNVTEKLTRGTVGVSALTGDEPMSRYASRNLVGALAGPSFGTISEAAVAIGAATSGDFQASDVHRVRKLLPGQNLFYVRNLLNQIEEDIASDL